MASADVEAQDEHTANSTSRTPSSDSDSKTGQQSRWKSAIHYYGLEISMSHADLPILACCLVSGLCDSSAYNAWSTFVSMQTGNTIFLALGASGQPIERPYGWLKSLTSIFFFLLGCISFAQTRWVSAKKRGTLAVSFIVQASCIIVAAALVQGGVVPKPQGVMMVEGVNFIELVAIAFLAFQSGGQMTTSRLLGFNEIPTTVLTSVYCDLGSDPKLLKKDNIKRNRRIGAVLCILIGGIIGGWISRSSAGMSVALWIAAGIKFILVIVWSLWAEEVAS